MPACAVALSASPPAPVMLIGALMAMAPAAFSPSVVAADQVSDAATVMLPACEPPVPVVIVTFAAPSAVCSVAALMTLSLVLASKLPPVLLAPPEIVTLNGSSSSVPKPPLAADRSVKPV